MAKVVAIVCSDLHIRQKRKDEQFGLGQIISAAIAENANVIAAGDLFDKQSNRAEAVSYFYKQLTRLHKQGLSFYFTQGQHDWDNPPWLSGHPAAIHLHKREVKIGPHSVYGLDWLPHGELQRELGEVPETSTTLVAHQVWQEWMGDIANPQGSFREIPGHIRTVITGDLHKWILESRKNIAEERMMVLSCGAIAKQKIDEPDEHYCAAWLDNGKFEQRVLRSRPSIVLSVINRPEDVDAVLTSLPSALNTAEQKAAAWDLPAEMSRPWLRVLYSRSVPDALARVIKAVDGRAVVVPTELMPSEKVQRYAQLKLKPDAAATPLLLLPEEIDRAESPMAYSLAEALLSATDREVVFAQWRANFLGDQQEEDDDKNETA